MSVRWKSTATVFSRHAHLYIGEIENRYLKGEVSRKVSFGLYKLPQVVIKNEKTLLKDGDIFSIGDIRIECFLVPGHTWGHLVYLIDDAYVFLGDTIWLGYDGGYSFINALAENNKLAIRSLATLKAKLEERNSRPMFVTRHTGYSRDFDFVFVLILIRPAMLSAGKNRLIRPLPMTATTKAMTPQKVRGVFFCRKLHSMEENDDSDAFPIFDYDGRAFLTFIGGRRFYPGQEVFTSAPKAVYEAVEEKPERFRGQHILGWSLALLVMLCMAGAVIVGAVDGIKNGFTFLQFYIRFAVMMLLLKVFDEFEEQDPLSARDLQDYQSVYLELYRARRRNSDEAEEINDDLTFEIELIKHVEVNVDCILMLVEKYRDQHEARESEEVRAEILRAVKSSPTLQNKLDLIEQFLEKVSPTGDISQEWREYIEEQKELELTTLVAEENLKPDATKAFVEAMFRRGRLETGGIEIENLLPNVPLFGAAAEDRASLRQRVVEKLQTLFDRFYVL